MSKLIDSGIRAVKWNTFTTILRFALQLIAQVILARQLGPENYGIFSIGMVVLTFSTFLANFGLGQSLLHKAEVSNDDIRFAFTWQVVAGLVAMSAVWLSAPFVAAFFNEPRSEIVIQWLSLTCLLSAASSPAGNLVQRNMRFKELGLAQLLSYVIGYLVIGVPMAIFGFQYEALVAAWLVQTAGVALASFALNPHPIKPLFKHEHSGAATNLSGILFMTNVVNWLLSNLDRIAVGKLLDTKTLGIYTASYNLATMPNSLLLSSLQPTLMAVGARMQGESERLRRGYLQILSVIWVLILPVFTLMSSAANEIVAVLYGNKWAGVVPILSLTFLAMPALISTGLSTPVLWGSGKRHLEAVLQAPIILIAIGAYTWMSYAIGGNIQVATGIAVSIIFLRMIVIYIATARAVELPLYSIFPIIFRGISFSILAYGIYYLAAISIPKTPAILLLIIGSTAVAVACIGLAWKFPILLGQNTIALVSRISPAVGRRIQGR